MTIKQERSSVKYNMRTVKYFLLLSAIAASGVVSEANYLLTYRRLRDNELFLFCSVWGNHLAQQNISFWINETEKIDIVYGIHPDHAAVYATPNLVSFILHPQYEGIFYCGEIYGNRSNGVGPMAGNCTNNMLAHGTVTKDDNIGLHE